ncbi:hypothetical protein AS850_07700 [Frondihabitans sp. 762G35]|uniref:hypothetical protein n=1 Tax=Frondihabitans sp. 762G35 TaxID=1446794 RepID=UPI000D207CDE|nr:hypothetical protein [Frondihabitans sp. 762G35]ARC56961.1 hypothetical protein AS850_07700 [Frondihabitans sp. 762G35]
MKQRTTVAVLGVVVVAVYAAVMACEALVLDPLAAVPGETLGRIHAHLRADGMDVTADIVTVIAQAVIGLALAAVVAIVGLVRRASPVVMGTWFLAIIAVGGFVAFGTGFALGMDVADSYGVGGEDHTLWAGVLYLTSLTAFLGLVFVGARALVRGRRSAPSVPA